MGRFLINSERAEFARFSKPTRIDNLISLFSSEEKIDYVNYHIFSIFSAEIWMYIVLFLIITSILGIDKFNRRTFLIKFLNSLIDHLECLIRNCSE